MQSLSFSLPLLRVFDVAGWVCCFELLAFACASSSLFFFFFSISVLSLSFSPRDLLHSLLAQHVRLGQALDRDAQGAPPPTGADDERRFVTLRELVRIMQAMAEGRHLDGRPVDAVEGCRPLPEHMVDHLPLFECHLEGLPQDRTSCDICLEEFQEGEMLRTLPCMHFFHRQCVDVWLTSRDGVCPLCRDKVQAHVAF